MPRRMPDVIYDDGVVTRSVRQDGCFSWRGYDVFIAEPLIGERVAFTPIDDGILLVRFSAFPIAVFDERCMKLFHAGWKPTNAKTE